MAVSDNMRAKQCPHSNSRVLPRQFGQIVGKLLAISKFELGNILESLSHNRHSSKDNILYELIFHEPNNYKFLT